MSYPSATIAMSDRQRGGRCFAPIDQSAAVPLHSSFTYLRNLPTDYPNALDAPGPWRMALPPQTILMLSLLLGCLIVRLIGALQTTSICPDGVMYIRLAAALEEGRFREAFEGLNLNLYPPILMLLHVLGLSWETAGRLWGVLISSLVILPLFGLFRRQFDDKVALVSCLLYAVHPVVFQWSTELIRDQTFWFLFTCTLYLQWRAVTEVRWGCFFAAGMTMTLAVLTRFEGLFLLIPLLFWTVWRCRALAEKPLRRRLIAGAIVAVTAFPAFIILANAFWLSRHSEWIFSRLSPLILVEQWWSGIMHPAISPPGTPVELQNLSFLRLVSIYVPALVKGLSPLFAVPMLIGLWCRRRLWARRDHQPLFYTAVVVMTAAWIHAWCGHESCDRYYLPIMLMASPFAAMGLLAISRWMLVWSEKKHAGRMFCRLAVAAPLAIVLLGSATVAFASHDHRRRAEVDLARWVQQEYGSGSLIFGSEGVTPVVAYYSRAKYLCLMKVMDDRAVMDITRDNRPDVILILATRRNDLQETRRLIDGLVKMGFREMQRDRLPADVDDVLVVLARVKR
jgi:hypothetical protein